MPDAGATSLAELVRARGYQSESSWAWMTYEPIIREWVAGLTDPTVLEIGAGRQPLVDAADIQNFGAVRYIANDMDPTELDRADPRFERACFDIQEPESVPEAIRGSCDLVFAKMVFEHIHDPVGAYTSVERLLKPGGSFISFMPTLFSPPFVLNKIAPHALTRHVLRLVQPERTESHTPKFPAYYRWCRADSSALDHRLRSVGFRDVAVFPLYGHSYFKSIPVVRGLDRALASLARRRAWAKLASYAYVVLVK